MSHYTMPNKYGKCTRDFGAFLFLLVSTFLYFGGVFKKTIILLALVGYEMICWSFVAKGLSIISYPTRARRIIVKYTPRKRCITSMCTSGNPRIGLLQQTITWYKIRHAGGQAHYYFRTGKLKQRDPNKSSLTGLCLNVPHGGFCTMGSFVAKGLFKNNF